MVTRKMVTAIVSFEKIFKDASGSVVTEQCEERIEKCDTKQKAEIILEKDNKGAIITITNIQFEQSTYKMKDEFFIEHAECVGTELVDPAELEQKAKARQEARRK